MEVEKKTLRLISCALAVGLASLVIARPAVGADAATILQTATIAAQSHDVAELMAQRFALEEMILKSASTCVELEAIREDRRTIAAADAEIKSTRYAEAVKILSDRWKMRCASWQPVSDGQVGVALLKACVAPKAIDGVWLKPTFAPPEISEHDALTALARDVTARCPLAIEATLFEAWLTVPQGKDELLRLDLRQQVLERNRLLLPLRQAFSSPKVWHSAAESGLHSGMPYAELLRTKILDEPLRTAIAEHAAQPAAASLLPVWSSQIEFLLGDSRTPAFRDQAEWGSLLSKRPVELIGDSGTRYLVIDDLLWEQTVGPLGIQWALLLPKPDADASA